MQQLYYELILVTYNYKIYMILHHHHVKNHLYKQIHLNFVLIIKIKPFPFDITIRTEKQIICSEKNFNYN